MTTFLGYRRKDGTVATRNYVAIIPVDDLSNAAVERVSHVIQAAVPLLHPTDACSSGTISICTSAH